MRQRRVSLPDDQVSDSDHSDTIQNHGDNASASYSLLSSNENQSISYGERGKDLRRHLLYCFDTIASFLKWNRQWIIPLAYMMLGVFITRTFLTPMFRPHPHIKHAFSHPRKYLPPSGLSGPRSTFKFRNGTRFIRPTELKVVGTVFFGRRQFVKILDCYLRRNLRINGGMLDEVQFILHTDRKEDVDWIERLIERDQIEHYKLLTEKRTDGFHKWTTFPLLYKLFLADPDTIYIKMDDDIVFIDDCAISELIRITLENPEAHNIQANIINNEWNQWHHLRTKSLWPYLPEQQYPGSVKGESWRPSELPRYAGAIPPKDFKFDKNYKPPSERHRWLPLKPTYENLRRTPFGHTLRDPDALHHDKNEQKAWTIGAQAHYSFFENFERRELMRYDFGNGHDNTWNLWYQRYSVNMFAIRGSHVLLEPNIWDGGFDTNRDELLLTKVIPKILDMPVMIATRAIAAHYAFHNERIDLLKTDILDRYKALANELYCMNSIIHEGNDENNGEDIGDGPQDAFKSKYADATEVEGASTAGHIMRSYLTDGG